MVLDVFIDSFTGCNFRNEAVGSERVVRVVSHEFQFLLYFSSKLGKDHVEAALINAGNVDCLALNALHFSALDVK